MGRATADQLSQELQDNLQVLLQKINIVRSAYGQPMIVNSGYRPASINSNTPGAAAHSWHTKCAAVDIADSDCKLWNWTLNNLELMQQTGLWMEHKNWTPTWVHYQIYAPSSGKRIFVPSSAPATAQIWDGNYDHSFDGN